MSPLSRPGQVPGLAAAMQGGPALAPVPAAETVVARVPAGPPVFIPGQRVEARTAVLAAYTSVQRADGEWVPYGVRLPARLAQQLKDVVADDKVRLRMWRLSATHYHEAAFSALPFGDVDKCAQVGRDWQASQPVAGVRQVTGPGTRLTAGTADAMHELATRLTALPGGPPIQDVAAGAIAALLAQLAQNPLSMDTAT
jgi:hypothetical protein